MCFLLNQDTETSNLILHFSIFMRYNIPIDKVILLHCILKRTPIFTLCLPNLFIVRMMLTVFAGFFCHAHHTISLCISVVLYYFSLELQELGQNKSTASGVVQVWFNKFITSNTTFMAMTRADFGSTIYAVGNMATNITSYSVLQTSPVLV